MTPSPSMLGSGSEKLMVRKKAMRWVGCSGGGAPGQSLRNRGRAFKPGTEPEHGGGEFAARNQRPARRPSAFDGDRVDPRHQLVERDRTAAGDHLAGQLLDAGAGAFQ